MTRPSSLIKFMDQRGEDGRGPLHWHRSHLDGAPFRGHNPFLTEEEYEERTTRVGDPRNAVFNLLNPEDNVSYLRVLDMVVNHWATVLHVERVITAEKKEVYIEWVQWYIEDGAAPLQSPPGIQAQGSQNGHSK